MTRLPGCRTRTAAPCGISNLVLDEDEAVLSRARTELLRALGPEGLVDAAAVVGLFNAIDRVADATGIPLEAEKVQASADFRAVLGLDRFAVGARS